MIGALEQCKHIKLGCASNLVLLDTCFFINFLEHHKQLPNNIGSSKLGTTSFNADELLHVEHKLNHDTRSKLHEFFRTANLVIVDVPVSPGDWNAERAFVNSIDDKLLAHVRDPSDAVLIAAAIRTGSCIVTRDKHHLFTVNLEGFLKPYGLKVYKDLKFLAEQSF
mgnify:CR=1 FL=1